MSNDVTCLLHLIILGEIIKGIRESCCSVPVADRTAAERGTVCQCQIFLQHNENTVMDNYRGLKIHSLVEYFMHSNNEAKHKLHIEHAA